MDILQTTPNFVSALRVIQLFLYPCGTSLDYNSDKLKKEINAAIKGLKNNEMVTNPSMYQLMFFSKFLVLWKIIESSDTVKLRGNTFNRNVNFKRHIENVCSKRNNKAKVLLRIRKLLKREHLQRQIFYPILDTTTNLDVLWQNE